MIEGIYRDIRDGDYCHFKKDIKSPWVQPYESFEEMISDMYESNYFKTSPHYLTFRLPSEFLYGE